MKKVTKAKIKVVVSCISCIASTVMYVKSKNEWIEAELEDDDLEEECEN